MGLNILLVEDEPLLRELAQEDLRDLGHNPHSAGDFDSALEALDSGADYDVLITDIRMPGRADGWELARLARMRTPEMGVIYISGFSGELPQLVVGGVFLKKPYRLNEMERALSGFIN
jgi:CheY-like chemotaxis protein